MFSCADRSDSLLCKVDRDAHDCHSSPVPLKTSSRGTWDQTTSYTGGSTNTTVRMSLQSDSSYSTWPVTKTTSTKHQYSHRLIHDVPSVVWSHVLSGVQHVSQPLNNIYSDPSGHQAASFSLCTNDHTVYGTSNLNSPAGCVKNKSRAEYFWMFMWMRIRGW